MSLFHPACIDCILHGNCLFQDKNDVDLCGDVIAYDDEDDYDLKYDEREETDD
jgi:hypothetical protein